MPDDVAPPQAIKSDGDAFRITWADGTVTRAPFARLRAACPCATCDDERARPANPFKILTEREAAAGPLKPVRVTPVGHYAYQVTWNDGHGTGIFTLAALRDLSDPTTEAS